MTSPPHRQHRLLWRDRARLRVVPAIARVLRLSLEAQETEWHFADEAAEVLARRLVLDDRAAPIHARER